MAERFASVSEYELCEKCIIKQLLNSVSHDIKNYENLVSVLRLRQITQFENDPDNNMKICTRDSDMMAACCMDCIVLAARIVIPKQRH